MRLRDTVLLLLEESRHTQKEFADAIGASPQTLNGWIKKGRDPSPDYVIPICLFFKISPNELFGYDAATATLGEDEAELLQLFRGLDRKGRRAVLHEADVQDDRVKQEGDDASTAQEA